MKTNYTLKMKLEDSVFNTKTGTSNQMKAQLQYVSGLNSSSVEGNMSICVLVA